MSLANIALRTNVFGTGVPTVLCTERTGIAAAAAVHRYDPLQEVVLTEEQAARLTQIVQDPSVGMRRVPQDLPEGSPELLQRHA